MSCQICPRKCSARGEHTAGYCGVDETCRVARISLHPYEEPCISGSRGSGTVFFSGCNLKCVFCQNAAIRDGNAGKPYSAAALSDAMLRLQDDSAHNINLVTPTPHVRTLVPALRLARKNGLTIPVVYNTGAYERTETIDMLDGLVDIYLPDLKFRHAQLALRFAHAADYFPVAMDAVARMLAQTGHLQLNADGAAVRGVLVRHLVLPNCVFDTRSILDAIAERFSTHCFLSVMRQYTPPDTQTALPLNRTIMEREYRSVIDHLLLLGFERVYLQEADSVGFRYTPDFSVADVNSREYRS